MVIAAPGSDAVDVFYGGSGLADLAQSRADVSVLGDAADEAGFGGRPVAGDWNGDGADDLLIGSPGTSLNAGKAHMVFGGGF